MSSMEDEPVVRICPCCGQPVNSRNLAEKFFNRVVEEEVRMTRDLFKSCFEGVEERDKNADESV